MNRIRVLLAAKPLLAFFVLAYLGSWLWWTPMWLTRDGIGLIPVDPPAPVILAANQVGLFAGPFAAAFLVTAAVDGRSGVRALVRRIVAVGRGRRWSVVAIIVLPIAVGVGYVLVGPIRNGGAVDGPMVVMLIITAVVYLLGGPIQEEPGWRGFALPRLQHRMHPLVAALVLGVVHCCWHAPLFLTSDWDTARGDAGQLLAYLVFVVALSMVLAWLSNAAPNSLVPAILGHNGANWALLVVATVSGTEVTNTWPAALGMTALALIAIAVTRGRLAVPIRPLAPSR